MTELGNVIARQPKAKRRLDLLIFEKNAKFFITDLRAFLIADAVGARKHQGWNDQGGRGWFFSRCRNRKVKAAAAIFSTLESKVADILLAFFHAGGFIIPKNDGLFGPLWIYILGAPELAGNSVSGQSIPFFRTKVVEWKKGN